MDIGSKNENYEPIYVNRLPAGKMSHCDVGLSHVFHQALKPFRALIKVSDCLNYYSTYATYRRKIGKKGDHKNSVQNEKLIAMIQHAREIRCNIESVQTFRVTL